MMLLDYLTLILQHSGPTGVVLIFWYLHAKMQDRREEHLLAGMFEHMGATSVALVALKTYLETKGSD
jgi:hypothetical protein